MNPFWRKEVLESRIVSAFLLFAICSHFSPPEVYPIFSFSWFTVTLENWELSFFLLFPICSHFGNPGVYLFFSFWRFAVTLGFMSVSAFYFFCNLRSLLVPGIVSYFLLLVICSHILTPEMYLHFSFFRFAVTYRRQKAMSKAWWVTKKRNKRRFSRLMLRGF